MHIHTYINLPSTLSTNSAHLYLTYSHLLISLLTGILLISFNIINQYTVIQSEFQIIYVFTLITIVKVVMPINYIMRTKSPKSRLEQEAQVDLRVLFVPSFIKSIVYFGLLMMTFYLQWLIVVIPVVFGIIGIEVLDWWIKKKSRYLLLSNSTSKDKKRKDKSRGCINIKQILIQITLIIAYILHVEYYELVYSVETTLGLCIIGVFSLLAYYYMHHQLFQLYHSDIDEVLSKQYPIQLFNFILYWIFHSLSSTSHSSTTNTNMNIQPKNYSSPGFLFILQYPVHTAIVIFFSVLYQYYCFEIIKKNSFKYLFLIQLTGIFWFNLYQLREGITTSRYFSTFLSFIAVVLLTRLVSIEKIYNRIMKMLRWLKIRTKDKKSAPAKMLQQEERK